MVGYESLWFIRNQCVVSHRSPALVAIQSRRILYNDGESHICCNMSCYFAGNSLFPESVIMLQALSMYYDNQA